MQEALDDLALYTKSYWKPFNTNTIFVTMDTPNKRRDYEEEVTRIFYLTNTTTNADLTAIVTAIRTVADRLLGVACAMLKARTLFDPHHHSLRGEPPHPAAA